MNNEFHISSFIVQAKPEHLEALLETLKTLTGVEIHQTSPEGKIVLTLECNNTGEISDITTAIGQMKGVLSCNMVFHQIEQEPANEHHNTNSLTLERG